MSIELFNKLQGDLKDAGLEEEAVNNIIKKAKEEYIPKEFVPKDTYKSKVQELETANSELETVNSKIEDLKELEDTNEELKGKLSDLNENFDEYKESVQKTQTVNTKKSLLKDMLLNEGADPKNVDLLMHEFDDKLDKFELDEENKELKGASDYLGEVKEKRDNLFVKVENNSPEPEGGENDTDTINTSTMRKIMGLD